MMAALHCENMDIMALCKVPMVMILYLLHIGHKSYEQASFEKHISKTYTVLHCSLFRPSVLSELRDGHHYVLQNTHLLMEKV